MKPKTSDEAKKRKTLRIKPPVKNFIKPVSIINLQVFNLFECPSLVFKNFCPSPVDIIETIPRVWANELALGMAFDRSCKQTCKQNTCTNIHYKLGFHIPAIESKINFFQVPSN